MNGVMIGGRKIKVVGRKRKMKKEKYVIDEINEEEKN
jgi:hypothetical protein